MNEVGTRWVRGISFYGRYVSGVSFLIYKDSMLSFKILKMTILRVKTTDLISVKRFEDNLPCFNLLFFSEFFLSPVSGGYFLPQPRFSVGLTFKNSYLPCFGVFSVEKKGERAMGHI